METLKDFIFEEDKAAQEKTLVIIGNGFDVAHGIESKYSDFKEWVREHNHELIDKMDKFFSNQRDIWGDIETGLGEYDESGIIDYCNPNEEIDYDHPTQYVAGVEDSPEWLFEPILKEFKDAFTRWVNDIDINDIEKLYKLPELSTYLTFNYTDTLEKEYGISPSRILHIHGSRIMNDDYIVGHNNLRNVNEPYDDDSDWPFVQDTKSKIIRWMNKLYKNCDKIIETHRSFFDNLKGVESIIVRGHSFCDVDIPYLKEIVNQTGKDARWIIYYFDDKDYKRIQDFVAKMGLTNVQKISLQ